MDIKIENGMIKTGKDEYKLTSVKDIQAKQLRFRDHLVRIISYALLFSAVGWIFFPIFGFFLFALGAIGALVTSKKYELRALFRETDETGDQWSVISRTRHSVEYEAFQGIVQNVKREIG